MSNINTLKTILFVNLSKEFEDKFVCLNSNSKYEIVKTTDSNNWIDDVCAYRPDVVVLKTDANNYDEQLSLLSQNKSLISENNTKVILASSVYNFAGYDFESLDYNKNHCISDIIEYDCSQDEFIRRLDFVCNKSN